MAKIEKRTGDKSELDAFFVCIEHDDTGPLIKKLRENKIKFTVDIEPEPPEDQSDEDIFWFESTSDISKIQNLINEVVKR